MVCEHDIVGDIIWMIRRNLSYYDNHSDNEISMLIKQHMNHGTIEFVYERNKLVGIVRINANGYIADVLDIIVEHEDAKEIFRLMAAELWDRFPYLKYFRFSRILKYPCKKSKIYAIKRLF